MKKACIILTLMVTHALHDASEAQKFTHENYHDFLPPTPKIISQTVASAGFHLYGNPQEPAYRDRHPVDGIDDERAKRLLQLAAKFSPVLHRNNFSVPREFEAMLRIKYQKDQNKITTDNQPVLYIDTWELAKPESKRVRFDFINLALVDSFAANNGHASSCDRVQVRCNDEKLKALLQEFHPDGCQLQHTHPEQHLAKVLYFDFPGEGEKSWRKIYEKLVTEDSKIYAHFFVHENSGAQDPARYELVVQYWFFYPFNDGGNNHEGDWEHLNARIATLARQNGLLSAEDVIGILDDNNAAILDSLVISKVDYYFHHFVMTLDYHALGLDFYQPNKKRFLSELRQANHAKVRQDWMHERIYDRIHLLKDTLNTHALGFIGADNKGLDQLTAFPGEKNRNPHGTYPFPGIWKRVGPFGATERVNGDLSKYKFLLPTAEERDKKIEENKQSWYNPKRNDNYLVYDEGNIILVPDWEMLKDSVLTNPSIRRKWYWLMLPIRWGFPVSGSIGAGLIKHADLGNVAPVGPAFNSAWNRVGATAGYEAYEPHILPLTFLLGMQDHFHNDWGFLNSLLAIRNLPPINVGFLLWLSLWESAPKFMRKDPPFRFASVAYRPSFSYGDDDFAHLLPRQSGAGIASENFKHERYSSPVGIMYNVHLGRFSGENTFSISESKVLYNAYNTLQQPIATAEGTLKLYEFTGSLRHSFSKGAFQPFVRAGYGWNWYCVENVRVNGEKQAKTEIFHKPSFPFLPNTWHIGAGVEIFFRSNHGIWKLPILKTYAGRPELGIRLDYTLHWHRLGKGGSNDLITRHEIGAGIVLGF
jgi:hypothetical protein